MVLFDGEGLLDELGELAGHFHGLVIDQVGHHDFPVALFAGSSSMKLTKARSSLAPGPQRLKNLAPETLAAFLKIQNARAKRNSSWGFGLEVEFFGFADLADFLVGFLAAPRARSRGEGCRAAAQGHGSPSRPPRFPRPFP